eukprot:TRINITY_DN12846_c0_g2_i1.p1 TRINITY_DN12846_c0_g2~~TRINITY_DN12846_c0_g2_i1.p1  ORF type:complete len:519 (-),score=110.61 TRINITY_DN12846_c0_g2_i1:195-1709(-)
MDWIRQGLGVPASAPSSVLTGPAPGTGPGPGLGRADASEQLRGQLRELLAEVRGQVALHSGNAGGTGGGACGYCGGREVNQPPSDAVFNGIEPRPSHESVGSAPRLSHESAPAAPRLSHGSDAGRWDTQPLTLDAIASGLRAMERRVQDMLHDVSCQARRLASVEERQGLSAPAKALRALQEQQDQLLRLLLQQLELPAAPSDGAGLNDETVKALRELQEERAQVAEMLGNVRTEKLEVIALMHGVQVNKDIALRELEECKRTAVEELASASSPRRNQNGAWGLTKKTSVSRLISSNLPFVEDDDDVADVKVGSLDDAAVIQAWKNNAAINAGALPGNNRVPPQQQAQPQSPMRSLNRGVLNGIATQQQQPQHRGQQASPPPRGAMGRAASPVTGITGGSQAQQGCEGSGGGGASASCPGGGPQRGLAPQVRQLNAQGRTASPVQQTGATSARGPNAGASVLRTASPVQGMQSSLLKAAQQRAASPAQMPNAGGASPMQGFRRF